MEENTENNSPWTDAEINRLPALWEEASLQACTAPPYIVTDAYVVTTATHEDKLSGHTNLS